MSNSQIHLLTPISASLDDSIAWSTKSMMVTFGSGLIKACVSCWVLALSDTSADNIMNN